MPTIECTDDQYERFRAIRAELEAVYVGEYGTVSEQDVLGYLLDTYSPPEELDQEAGGVGANGGGSGRAGATAGAGEGAAADGHDDGAARLESMMSLLDDHEDVWRESGDDEPYEVDLPDGSVETARTKDHVRQLLFQHYR